MCRSFCADEPILESGGAGALRTIKDPAPQCKDWGSSVQVLQGLIHSIEGQAQPVVLHSHAAVVGLNLKVHTPNIRPITMTVFVEVLRHVDPEVQIFDRRAHIIRVEVASLEVRVGEGSIAHRVSFSICGGGPGHPHRRDCCTSLVDCEAIHILGARCQTLHIHLDCPVLRACGGHHATHQLRVVTVQEICHVSSCCPIGDGSHSPHHLNLIRCQHWSVPRPNNHS
mmetsp:Transcript_18245/g.42684  ORF Transcript_18245/g.42684 Transcript_18245/m.42684 type:complete len:226 (-) Transcript_18245:368-1045(-)